MDSASQHRTSGNRACYRWLDKHKRLHAQHGPIDLIIQVEGRDIERRLAFDQAKAFFDSVLSDLVAELDQLRSPVADISLAQLRSVVGRHMLRSVAPYKKEFVTPMAAVAGSVADCTLAALCHNRKLERAFVNNGGDIALHLPVNSQYTMGICESTLSTDYDASVQINCLSSIRGVATSGWHGRSHSLGIADAVTVLAKSAADADTAATLIANRIDLPGSGKVQREAANELAPQSDLGDLAVTVAVQALTKTEKVEALLRGHNYAQVLIAQGLIDSAFMSLQGQRMVAGCIPSIHWKQTA